MPLFESYCDAECCDLYHRIVEHYYPHFDSPMQACPSCRGITHRLLSTFNVVFTGAITARYNDRKLEGAHLEGHTTWERDPITKKPRKVEIKTWDDQRAFCARNHCALPSEMPKNMVVKEDGKSLENTRGLPGTEL